MTTQRHNNINTCCAGSADAEAEELSSWSLEHKGELSHQLIRDISYSSPALPVTLPASLPRDHCTRRATSLVSSLCNDLSSCCDIFPSLQVKMKGCRLFVILPLPLFVFEADP